MEAGRDLESGAMLAVLARRYGVERDEQVVKPSAAGQSGVVRRVDHVARREQLVLRVFQREDLREPLRADSRPTREEPLEMKGTHAHVLRHLVQAWPDRRGIIEKPDCSLDPKVVGAIAIGA